MSLILGIDTSNYTTSLALVDDRGHLVIQERKLLDVEAGERGLQQSAAVFQHLTRLPELLEKVWQQRVSQEKGEKLSDSLVLVAVSTRPRPQEGSYMPVFRVGEGYARTLAAALQVPLLETTHQEGHLMAGLWSAGGPQAEEFLAVHLSGGTTELLKVNRVSMVKQTGELTALRSVTQDRSMTQDRSVTQDYLGNRFSCVVGGRKAMGNFFEVKLLGGTQDLHAGQFVDRVGVALGLSFPAGPSLEKLALEAGERELALASSVKGLSVSFSGPESQAQRLIAAGHSPAEIARAVEKCIASSLEKILRKAVQDSGIKDILIVGGVAANQYIRKRLRQRLEHPAVKAKLFFAEPAYSSDNAVGVAMLGREYLQCK